GWDCRSLTWRPPRRSPPARAPSLRLTTFLPPGHNEAVAGAILEDRAIPFAEGISVRDVLAGRQPRSGASWWPRDEIQLLAPVPDPGTVYAIGLNYAKHVEETGGTKPEQPIVFVKVRGSVAP